MAKINKKIKEQDIPTRKAWVVLESCFEYDDNYYNQEGEGGGTPIKVYLDKGRAEDACLKANISDLCSRDLNDYSWSLRDSDGTKETVISLVENAGGTVKGGKERYDDFEIDLPDTVTKQQVDNIISELNINFNIITEIDLEMYIGD
jgi:hypothetical protein